jgi:hypothetical protein
MDKGYRSQEVGDRRRRGSEGSAVQEVQKVQGFNRGVGDSLEDLVVPPTGCGL